MNTSTIPKEFETCLYSLRNASLNKDVHIKEIETPQKIAPFSAALDLECDSDVISEGGRAKFVILYDPKNYTIWKSNLRIVVVVHAHAGRDLTSEEMISEVVWSWLYESLSTAGAGFMNACGTVNISHSTSFGGIRGQLNDSTLELRASWTPNTYDLAPHLEALTSMLCMLSGKIVDLSVN